MVDRNTPGAKRITKDKTNLSLNPYRGVLASNGIRRHSEPAVAPRRRGRKKRGKALNLLDRFRDSEQEVLGSFLYEGVPFDNNQA